MGQHKMSNGDNREGEGSEEGQQEEQEGQWPVPATTIASPCLQGGLLVLNDKLTMMGGEGQ